jgi:hypothetical protein
LLSVTLVGLRNFIDANLLRTALRSRSVIGLDFLATDVAFALSLLDRAALACDPDTIRRNLDSAAQTYGTVSRALSRLDSRERNLAKIKEQLAVLRARLSQLGHPV